MGETRMNTRHRQIVASQTPIRQHDICLRKCLVNSKSSAFSSSSPSSSSSLDGHNRTSPLLTYAV